MIEAQLVIRAGDGFREKVTLFLRQLLRSFRDELNVKVQR